MDFNFKKKFGQNFIFDKNLINSILQAGDFSPECSVLEIGAGAGTLTEALANNFKSVISYEIDEDLKPTLDPLSQKYDNLNIIYKDVLSVPLGDIENALPQGYILIANLPYYITTPIVFRFLNSKKISALYIMVQKEVGERFVAQKGTKAYGIPSVLINILGTASITKKISRTCFKPVPNVDSCMVKISLKPNYLEGISTSDLKADFMRLSGFVNTCFAMRRKTLLNNLSKFSEHPVDVKTLASKFLTDNNLTVNARAEELSPSLFVELFKLLCPLA
jgi:16S rRNA (adenine1518-N6/adenine1519-N6)-dimethyltransferase